MGKEPVPYLFSNLDVGNIEKIIEDENMTAGGMLNQTANISVPVNLTEG